MEVRDKAMEGTFHTILVEPFERSFQDVKDADNYWNRGETAKYKQESHGLQNAVRPMYLGSMPKGEGSQSQCIQKGRVDRTPFHHVHKARDTHGLHVQSKFQSHHEPVFSE